MCRLNKTKKTGMRNAAFLMALAAVLSGCGEAEADTQEQTLTVAEDEEQTAEVVENSNVQELNEYRLCRKELETENGIYILELWLDQGIYGSVEEFGAGGGIYEENYIGKYYLNVTDENGEVLSKRELGLDFEEGDRMNFSGPFEIMVEDYNQDGCPDFTIGSYGSSSVNLYVLYTVREDGKLELLGKEIPNCSLGEFSVAFEKGENGTFFGSMWDNAVGEKITIVYMWDEEQKKYVESENPDTAP